MRPKLRIFHGEETQPALSTTMTINFGELMQILDDASRRQRSWLNDFSDDGVQIPEDLYEVLTEYTRLRPGA